MSKYLHIDLSRQTVATEQVEGEDLVRGGRYRIAKTLLARGIAKVDPMSPANPLIFTTGAFAGSGYTNANRLSIGCRSPLTGGIKEANAGGTFAAFLGQLGICGFTLDGAAQDWTVLRIGRDGAVAFDPAGPYLGQTAGETAAQLFAAYGKDASLAICGPVGEYQGLLAGIGITDREGRPSRMAARGGVGAVMGMKKVKAIVVEKGKAAKAKEPKAFTAVMREHVRLAEEHPAVKNFHDYGTAILLGVINHMGGLPTRNFSSGQISDGPAESVQLSGENIRKLQLERGGHPSHTCMPGCVIQCSNVYVDEHGKEMVAPLEYETLGLMGTNCGFKDPDVVARHNAAANELGVDSIEFGALMGMLMGAGQAPFGDVAFVDRALEDLRVGNERGRILAQGCAKVAEHYGIARAPVIKGQALSAYDPRVIEVTGVSMRTSAQGADHTTGAVPLFTGQTLEEVATASFNAQVNAMVGDTLGMCLLGRGIHDIRRDILVDAIAAFHGVKVDPDWLNAMGREGLRMEQQFNREVGFTEADDEPPAFLREPLPPTNRTVRFTAGEIHSVFARLMAAQ